MTYIVYMIIILTLISGILMFVSLKLRNQLMFLISKISNLLLIIGSLILAIYNMCISRFTLALVLILICSMWIIVFCYIPGKKKW